MRRSTAVICVTPATPAILVISVSLTNHQAMARATKIPSPLALRTLSTTALLRLCLHHLSSSSRSHPPPTLPFRLHPRPPSLPPAIRRLCHPRLCQPTALATLLLQASPWAAALAFASLLARPASPSTSIRSALLSSQLPLALHPAPLHPLVPFGHLTLQLVPTSSPPAVMNTSML